MTATIVYFSSTGNTTAMADAISAAAGIPAIDVADASAADVLACDVIVLGCSAMGAEELDADYMEPLFSEIEGKLSGKKVALFGSYGWGDGEWMRTWFDRCVDGGAEMIQSEGLMANEYPNDDALAACAALGEQIKGLL